MTVDFSGTERYDPARHDVSGFESGNELMDRWLVRYAGQNERRDAARTFVTTTDGNVVRGYYSLLAGELAHGEATATTRRGLSRHFPIPVAILARLAVDSGRHGRGLGAALLDDALTRVQRASEQIAVRAVVVHAVDENATSFYEHFGSRALTAMPRTLMVTVAEWRGAGYR